MTTSFSMGSSYLLHSHFPSSTSSSQPLSFHVKKNSNNNEMTGRRRVVSACMGQEDPKDIVFSKKRAVLFFGISVLPFLQLRARALEGLVTSKIVFAAPSRPLVMQQIEACHNIVGIPQEWTIDMTGQVCPTKRACFWKTKRVFFVTPQVLEKDIQSGTCLAKHLVCLVIDEAHRASRNYSYCVAIRELLAIPVHLRILALTATPGSKQPAVQHIIDNLQLSALEYRNERDPDVIPYVHDRKIELLEVALG
ncbi:hypothetical protein BDE02_13G100100 [Populus trichocarpa]|nr:hypothetical protein BDE02_13G100100 [Populus trichocarpa]